MPRPPTRHPSPSSQRPTPPPRTSGAMAIVMRLRVRCRHRHVHVARDTARPSIPVGHHHLQPPPRCRQLRENCSRLHGDSSRCWPPGRLRPPRAPPPHGLEPHPRPQRRPPDAHRAVMAAPPTVGSTASGRRDSGSGAQQRLRYRTAAPPSPLAASQPPATDATWPTGHSRTTHRANSRASTCQGGASPSASSPGTGGPHHSASALSHERRWPHQAR